MTSFSLSITCVFTAILIYKLFPPPNFTFNPLLNINILTTFDFRFGDYRCLADIFAPVPTPNTCPASPSELSTYFPLWTKSIECNHESRSLYFATVSDCFTSQNIQTVIKSVEPLTALFLPPTHRGPHPPEPKFTYLFPTFQKVFSKIDALTEGGHFNHGQRLQLIERLFDAGFYAPSIELNLLALDFLSPSDTKVGSEFFPDVLYLHAFAVKNLIYFETSPGREQTFEIAHSTQKILTEVVRLLQSSLQEPNHSKSKSKFKELMELWDDLVSARDVLEQVYVIMDRKNVTIDPQLQIQRDEELAFFRKALDAGDDFGSDPDVLGSVKGWMNFLNEFDKDFAWKFYHQKGVEEVPSWKWDYTVKEQQDRWNGVLGGDESGGWCRRESSYVSDHVGYSNDMRIDRRVNLSVEEFDSEYRLKGSPVIMDGLIDDWGATKSWRKDNLIKRFEKRRNFILSESGEKVVQEQSFGGTNQNQQTLQKYINTKLDTCKEVDAAGGEHLYELSKLSKKERRRKLSKQRQAGYKEKSASYLFQRIAGELSDDWSQIKHFDSKGDNGDFPWSPTYRHSKAFFFLGLANTGLALHSHTAAYNSIVFGRKRWFLLPPGAPKIPTTSAFNLEFYAAEIDKLPVKPIIIDQYPGETIYVPNEWQHAVFNLEVSVGISVHMGGNCQNHNTCRHE